MENLILHKTDNDFLQINHLDNIDALIDEIFSSVTHNQINYFYLKRQKYRLVWELQKKIHDHVKNVFNMILNTFKHVYNYVNTIQELINPPR